MKSKNRKIILILVIAIVVGLLGGVLLYFFLKPQKTTIWLFKDNYEAGEELTDEMLYAVQIDSNAVVAGKSSDTSSVFVTGEEDKEAVINSGDSLRMDVSAGMPLATSLLSVTGGSSLEMNMDPAKTAVTVPVDTYSGITSDLKEGSRVNVYTTGYATENGSTSATSLLFQNMRVLGIVSDSSGSITGVTLEMSVEESLQMINAETYSSITLSLVDGGGYEYVDDGLTYAPGSTNTSEE